MKFRVLKRGINRTPKGTKLEIIECNAGISGSMGTLKGTIVYGLRHLAPPEGIGHQIVATSSDKDDLYLLCVEHEWWVDDERFAEVAELF